jgi:hypothetical protein
LAAKLGAVELSAAASPSQFEMRTIVSHPTRKAKKSDFVVFGREQSVRARVAAGCGSNVQARTRGRERPLS